MEATEPHGQRQQESKETISAGQYQVFCHYKSQRNYFRIPLHIITQWCEQTWGHLKCIAPRWKELSCFVFTLHLSLNNCF